VPFDELIDTANSYLTERGFEALDELNGVIGGDRHGVWDFTWISHRLYPPLCYASMYAWGTSDGVYTVEVWARSQHDLRDGRSLVAHLEDVRDTPQSDHYAEILSALRTAASRALRLNEMQPRSFSEFVTPSEEYGDDSASSEALQIALAPRVPFAELMEIMWEIMNSRPESVWTNRQLLLEALQRGYVTDRADVNSALAELADSGRAHRYSRGHYGVASR
jgi:hypothetical protein